MILFGSAARGTAGSHSDLDFLVIKRDVEPAATGSGHLSRSRRYSGSIDIVVVTPEDVEALKDGVATIVGPAMREGREVYAA